MPPRLLLPRVTPPTGGTPFLFDPFVVGSDESITDANWRKTTALRLWIVFKTFRMPHLRLGSHERLPHNFALFHSLVIRDCVSVTRRSRWVRNGLTLTLTNCIDHCCRTDGMPLFWQLHPQLRYRGCRYDTGSGGIRYRCRRVRDELLPPKPSAFLTLPRQ
jgi:hypothetical protein